MESRAKLRRLCGCACLLLQIGKYPKIGLIQDPAAYCGFLAVNGEFADGPSPNYSGSIAS